MVKWSAHVIPNPRGLVRDIAQMTQMPSLLLVQQRESGNIERRLLTLLPCKPPNESAALTARAAVPAIPPIS